MKEYTPQNPVFSDKFNLVERADNVNAQIHNASVKQAMDNTVALKKQLDSYMGSVEDGKPQFADGIESGDVVGAINEVFTLGSEKKAQLVENLTAMGMQASTSDTWEVLLEKILDMTDTSGDTVTAPVLLTGYTAHDASGEQINGVMPEMATVTVEAVATTQDSEYTYLGMPEGHYDENSKVRTKNSNLSVTSIVVPVSLQTNASEAIRLYGTLAFPFSAQSVVVNAGGLDSINAPSPYTPNATITYNKSKSAGVQGAFSGTITFLNVKF